VGIRTKLIASLSGILVVLTVILGAAFAVREQRVILELKRDHLQHSAELVSVLLVRIGAENAESTIRTLNDRATGAEIRVALRTDPPKLRAAPDESSDHSPEVLSVSIPLPFDSGGSSQSADRLILEEALPGMRAETLSTVRGHIALGLILTFAAVLAVAVVCQRLVVQPIQWLVDAADGMANGEGWEPIQPESRRRDEIGELSNHLADLSRRLSDAVRSARHSSAHLVAEGVRRDMAEPLRRLALSLSIIQATTCGDAEMDRQTRDIEQQLKALDQLAQRLRDAGVKSQA